MILHGDMETQRKKKGEGLYSWIGTDTRDSTDQMEKVVSTVIYYLQLVWDHLLFDGRHLAFSLIEIGCSADARF